MNNKLLEKKVTKRKVFYIAGYDPRGIRFYYQNLKTAIQKFSERDNEIISLSTREKISDLETNFKIKNETQHTETNFSFLHWDDIIKKTWIRSSFQLFLHGLISYWQIFLGFSWNNLLKLSRAPIITLFYPFISIIWFPLLATLILSFLYPFYGMPLVYLIISCFIMIKFLPKINALWLLRFFVFNNQYFIFYNKDFNQRAQKFSKIIESAFDEDYDEVLLIAHSNGSIASIPVLQYIDHFPKNFKMLTLGHCLPLISMNKNSQDYLEIMQKVSQKGFKWFDIGFPPDGACYAHTNPFYSYQYDNEKIHVSFKATSPQFFKYYDADTYGPLRKDKFNLHFSYLVTHDKKSPTEYVRILTHNQQLETCFI